jgi:hypothetical protein
MRDVRRKFQKVFIFVLMITMILSNFTSIIPVKGVYAIEEGNKTTSTNPEQTGTIEIVEEEEAANEPAEPIQTEAETKESEEPVVEVVEDSEPATETNETTKENEATQQTVDQSETPAQAVEQPSEIESNQPLQENEVIEEEKVEQETKASLEEDFNSNSHLLITEVSPNSNGSDYYEFFEVYNNTNQQLSLTNYTFIYRYTDSGKEVVFQIPTTTIEPRETLVLWFNNNDLTLADFNNHFGSKLTNKQVVEFKGAFSGFANGGNRAAVIKDREGHEVTSASYLPNETDNSGLGVQYIYAPSNTLMDKHQVLAAPTPGSIEAIQVPTKQVELERFLPIQRHQPLLIQL